MSNQPKFPGKPEKRQREEHTEEDTSSNVVVKKKSLNKPSLKPDKKLTESKDRSPQPAETSGDEGIKNQTNQKHPKPQEKKTRYILYVTNIPYDATKDDIEKHFGCLKEKLVSIRMLTDKGTGQFRGTCFIDCADKESYAVALKLHHTKILGRKIVVEPTVGGGGKGENRMQKLSRKREKFSEVRKKRMRKSKPKQKRPAGAGGGGGNPDA
jgi:nucleolar protein 6